MAADLVRGLPLFVPQRDVGLDMLRCGLATTYEAKTGAEFSGPASERRTLLSEDYVSFIEEVEEGEYYGKDVEIDYAAAQETGKYQKVHMSRPKGFFPPRRA
ncbi:hypothetical protein QBC33DRAFT_520225 [Phialemonium atrogriseum]|uniref:Uncharacterized protein n=1 Tax=Phialemonium atrogriseum TaxID=1093897 RepID=A0AAJ0BP08_9PEZI|nr:uncharacterized protein QBC33DRAFT_520225 [Phialemonium atrogriseum]KAK1761686.1 hypothetical protein QBC33DRAFT_520225 [Phialemonium atrogriseum]